MSVAAGLPTTVFTVVTAAHSIRMTVGMEISAYALVFFS